MAEEIVIVTLVLLSVISSAAHDTEGGYIYMFQRMFVVVMPRH